MMAFITIEDFVGSIECIVFPKIYENHKDLIDEDSLIIIEGRLSISEVDEPKIICEKIAPLNNYKLDKLYIKIAQDKSKDVINKINTILKKSPGDTPIYIYFEKNKNLYSRPFTMDRYK